MDLARITSKGQMTIPKRIREAARLKSGDLVSLDVQNDRILMRKVKQMDEAYLRSVQSTLGEWGSPEDEEAWRDL
ncbi:MAG: AbrB/MazE/SpoVT family DNA-binding domain-containing protein [Alphaproteobacteria bacterium]|nr:AbrB/MazE/SpoVT family DNA-binding domain-containing protein [Alphaproteobacteria bacterium]